MVETPMTGEKETLEKIREGNFSAFRELVDAHQQKLYDLALRMTGNPEDAADLAQTAFVRMYEKLSSYDPAYSFSN